MSESDDGQRSELDQAVAQAVEHASGGKIKASKGTVAANIFAIAALLGSAGNFVYGGQDRISTIITKEDNITEAAYDKLRTAIEEQSEAVEQSQKDIVGLRNFMAGYMQAIQASRSVQSKPAASAAKLLPPVRKPDPKPELPNYGDVKYEAALKKAEAKE